MMLVKASGVLIMMLMLGLSGCVVAPAHHVQVAPPKPAPTRDVYIYPNNGQSAEQTDRDRYECHLWAVKQSHFDPSTSSSNEAPRVTVVAPPSGANTAAGAVTGAILGAAADEQNQQQADRAQRQYDRQYTDQVRPAEDYRRAVSACLEGRGYTVK